MAETAEGKVASPFCVGTRGEEDPPGGGTHSWETQPATFPPSEAQVKSATLGVDPSEDGRRCHNVNAVGRRGSWFTSQKLAQAWPKAAVYKHLQNRIRDGRNLITA